AASSTATARAAVRRGSEAPCARSARHRARPRTAERAIRAAAPARMQSARRALLIEREAAMLGSPCTLGNARRAAVPGRGDARPLLRGAGAAPGLLRGPGRAPGVPPGPHVRRALVRRPGRADPGGGPLR